MLCGASVLTNRTIWGLYFAIIMVYVSGNDETGKMRQDRRKDWVLNIDRRYATDDGTRDVVIMIRMTQALYWSRREIMLPPSFYSGMALPPLILWRREVYVVLIFILSLALLRVTIAQFESLLQTLF